jgi:hypothetical protein
MRAGIRVSSDTKTWAILPYSCGSPLYPAPTGGLRLPAGPLWGKQTFEYVNRIPNNSKQKNERNALFFAPHDGAGERLQFPF